MEMMLRLELPDVPGSLSKVANVIATVNGDIHAVEVKASTNGIAIDDLWVHVDHPDALLEAFELVDGVRVLYMGPSRGLPGVNTMRMSAIIQNILGGTMPIEQGVIALVGGNLYANEAHIEPRTEESSKKDRRVLRIPLNDKDLILKRDYRFLDEEHRQAIDLVTLCEQASAHASSDASVREAIPYVEE
ncbi:ACT domain-containing protein [Stomatohabitans albus]|uniref:ACT domain-containing protein n=1 Tax=Stomatohabitans albus TaxID=3110766 RepID=UPI00300D9B46